MSENGIDRIKVVGIRECARCGKVGDDSEEFGVEGVARIAGNLCVECVRELHPGGERDAE
ncbi:hypothetical protein OB905_13105 [Halobacteria archaeon AArc-dxtr1]|nr:hypothetical protein [Halobacteria archaeon AArc-dxtr1]